MEQEVIHVSKFKAACLTLPDKVTKTGRPILVTKRGEPNALITPPPAPRRPAGLAPSGGQAGSSAASFHRHPANLSHQDPVDRFLAATSMVFDLTLVTPDERLLDCKGLPVLANR